MLLYVSGPYSGDIDANIAQARRAAIDLWERGYAVLCPHLNTQHFEVDCKVGYEDYIRRDIEMVRRCDGMVMLPGWEGSKGALREKEVAEAAGIPVTVYPEAPEPYTTEKTSPVQVAAFLDTVMKMYRVHLAKNADYSPANILGTGNVGLITRLWDKMARLMNLAGFRVVVAHPAEYEAPKNPKNESVEDTLLDLANYGVIGLLLRQGRWGR